MTTEPIIYNLRQGGSRYGLSYYTSIMTGCLRKIRLGLQGRPEGASPEWIPDYNDRGIQFHALTHIWIQAGQSIDVNKVILKPNDHSAATNTTQWVDTKYLFKWFQTRISPKIFGKIHNAEQQLGPHKLFDILPMSGIPDLISSPGLAETGPLDMMFDLRLTDLRKTLGRDPIVMWDWKVVTNPDTASYVDGLQSVAYPLLAEIDGLHIDAFVHVFVFRGLTNTHVLKSRKKEDERVYIPNPNHKWYIFMLRSEAPTPRRQNILESFLRAVQRRVKLDDGGFPVPVDEPNAIRCRGPGMTCWALEQGLCDRT